MSRGDSVARPQQKMILTSSRRLRVICLRLSLAAAMCALPAATRASSANSSAIATAGLTADDWSSVPLCGINPRVFALALEAASSAIGRGQVDAPATLTLIDYSKPSTEPRMWVYDLRSHALLFQELVSHGRGSGVTMAT